jgi:hypothetical protein
MQGINMNSFVQATEHEVYMYAKFEYLIIYRYLQLNTSRFQFLKFSTMQ